MKVEVAILGSPSFIDSLYGLSGRKATLERKKKRKEKNEWSCVKVEVAVLGSPSFIDIYSPYGLCGRKATLNLNSDTQSSGAV